MRFIVLGEKMEKIENKKDWITLSLIKEISNQKKLQLLEKYWIPDKIFQRNKKILQKTKEIEEKINRQIQYMQKNKIQMITIQEKEYPEQLKQIYDPPIVLYIKGQMNNLNQENIAIIGCRECSEYGRKVAQYLGYSLGKQQNCIVSGLAKGIDSEAHKGCLKAKGKTIAVLGTGLDTIYPKENKKLYEEIIQKGGTIISEYPIGTPIQRMNFPARNRIVSGISKSVIVVEAKKRSGTLITVDFALEQGREVYVVPGNIDSENSVGTNELIKQGAQILTNVKDILR